MTGSDRCLYPNAIRRMSECQPTAEKVARLQGMVEFCRKLRDPMK